MAALPPHQVRRVAFLTPEFVTEPAKSGGVASYVLKMGIALTARGVEVEVFVPSQRSGEVVVHGLRVHHVRPERSILARGAARVLMALCGPQGSAVVELLTARRLAAAVERRHAEDPFNVIQSSNHELTGAFVRRAPDRVHVTRVSTSRRLYDRGSGGGGELLARIIEWADVRALRRADLAYAPSEFLAGHFRRTYGLEVAVVRPPAELGARPAERLTFPLPARYLVHFGNLSSRKGTDAVAQALVEAWQIAPDLRMVWIGGIDASLLEAFQVTWGVRSTQVCALGRQDHAVLYRVVGGAVAAVLPSTVDNLPNTVIESLVLGIPVIGTRGASIDELVEDGASGRLVPIGDVRALGQAMAEAWRGEVGWAGDGFRQPAILDDMRPDRAVQAFLALVGAALGSRA